MSSGGTAKTENLEAELVVIGAGGGGLPAAVAAAKDGLNVIVLEKRRTPGGNAVMAGGPRGTHPVVAESAESVLRRSQAVDDNRDNHFNNAMEWSHWRMDGRLMRTLIDRAGGTIRWLQENGVEFEQMGVPGGDQWSDTSPRPAGFIAVGPGSHGFLVVQAMNRRCKELGVPVLCNTRAKKLLTGKTGRVVGVLAAARDKEIKISARAVIMSTGGFLGSKKFMKKYFHSYDENLFDEMHIPGLSHTGDGLQMAGEVDAAVNGPVAFEWEGNRFPWLSMASTLAFFADDPKPIWVNTKGLRFCCETCRDATNSLYNQPHKSFYTLMDEDIKQKFFEVVNPMRGPLDPEQVAGELKSQGEQGRVKIADSWGDIAEFMGVAPQVLKNTIDEYNTCCDKGYDDTFLKDPGYLLPLRTPPYYAIKCGLTMLVTRGPIKVNHLMEVVNLDGDAIPGLYAAGVDIAGTDSDTYWGSGAGHSLGFAITSGIIAAENAARLIKG